MHGFGILFGIISIPILITLSVKGDNLNGIIGSSVYGFCFLMVFTFSTLYHGFQHEKVKRALKILDHISIYYLIAGTYTPLILIYNHNSFWNHSSLCAVGVINCGYDFQNLLLWHAGKSSLPLFIY